MFAQENGKSTFRAALTSAWRARGLGQAYMRTAEESAFLPVALALRDTPVHPAPRIFLWILSLLVAFALVWSIVGQVDIIASMPGKLVPTGEVKAIQSQEVAVIRKIYVADGQHVKAGQILVDLDATDATTDLDRARSGSSSTRVEMDRSRWMLDAIDHGKPPEKSVSSLAIGADERAVLVSEYADFTAKVREADSEVDQQHASLRETDAEIQKLEKTLPIEEKKRDDFTSLAGKGFVGKHDLYNEQQSAIQMEQDLKVARSRRVRTLAELDGAQRRRDTYVAETRKSLLEKIHDDQEKLSSLSQDVIRSTQHQALMHLESPVDGTVQQLSVHTIGGVVTQAQTLMTVVPANVKLKVNAIVDNQDVGFIRVGQVASVKVEAFPYTRYGTLSGHVTELSGDAKQDDKLGLIFTAEVLLGSDSVDVDGRKVSLVPGMAVTAEVKTGRRSIISYLLSPLVEHADESLRER